MSVPPLDLDSLLLASHVTKVFGVIHRIAYALVSPNLRLLRASSNFYTILNEPTGPIEGRALTELVWEFVGVEEDLKGLLDGRLPYLAFERINRRKADNSVIYLDLTVTPINDAELIRGLLLIIEDVTHTAEMEQQLTQSRNELMLARQQLARTNVELLRVNRLKSLFLSMAVHDLRSPLTAISTYSDLVMRTLPPNSPKRLRDFMSIIQTQATRLDWLIDDFLDLDQIEQGKLGLSPKMTDLNELVREVTDMMSLLAVSRQQHLALKFSTDSLVLMLDANRIRQILYNLISNALKYSPNNGRITIATTIKADTAILSVADNGRGMTEAQLKRIFQIYYRTEESAQSGVRGKGLGLFIVKMLVEAHRGNVFVASQPGEGTIVEVRLPLNADVLASN